MTELFEIPGAVWCSLLVLLWLSLSTIIISFFLFREKKMYTINEIVNEYAGDDIMNPPVSVMDEFKRLLRTACKTGKIKAKKVKGKWYICSKSEAIKYLIKYELKR